VNSAQQLRRLSDENGCCRTSAKAGERRDKRSDEIVLELRGNRLSGMETGGVSARRG